MYVIISTAKNVAPSITRKKVDTQFQDPEAIKEIKATGTVTTT